MIPVHSQLRQVTSACLVAILVSIGLVPASAQVTISEFLAVATAASLDDDGEPSGWVEITNNGASGVSLAGYHLTNDGADLEKWTFPAVSLAPSASHLIYVSGKDRRDPAAALHTNFVLDPAGSYLALIRPDGVGVESEFSPSFPPQFPGLSFGRNYSGGKGSVELVPWGSVARFLVPTDDSLGTSWRGSPEVFDDSSWAEGAAALGFGFISGPNSRPHNTDLQGAMRGINSSAYFRFPFDFNSSTDRVLGMVVNVVIDDGFVAYLNGVQISEFNEPPSPTWNSLASSLAEGELVSRAVSIDFASVLVDGENVLAIHGMNASFGSSDFIVDAELTAEVQDISGGLQAGYFETPTPGQTNGAIKSGQMISFDPPPAAVFGGAPINLTASASSGLPVSFAIVSGPGSLSGSVLSPSGVGEVTVRASQPGNSSYIAAPNAERTIVISEGEQVIDFPAIGGRTFGDAPFDLVATAGSGLPVSFELLSGPAELDGTRLTITGAGQIDLRASQTGDANWSAAEPVDQSFTVGKSPQSIAFQTPADRAFDDPESNLSASADSGLPVAFEIVGGPAVISGIGLATSGVGMVTVRASQAGNADYLAAPPVERSFVSGYRLELAPTAGGGIVASPAGSIYPTGEVVSLAAVEDAGYRFTGWGGGVTGSDTPAEITMDAHQNVSAEFRRIWSFQVEAGENGRVVVSPEKVEYLDGDRVTLTPLPDEGYALEAWGGDVSGEETPLVLTLAADTNITASFVDIQAPTVQIFSPVGGTTDNQFHALFGTATDNDDGVVLRWERDGIAEGELELTAGTFNVTGLVLHPGDNTFTVHATDPTGNVGSDEVTIRWVPERTLFLAGAPETREGKLLRMPLMLESGGNVGGMTFVIDYDPQFVTSPEVSLDALALGISQVNTDTPGEVRVTFALPSTALPAGEISLGTVDFRARSVPFELTTTFGVTVDDVSDPDGSQITFGTHTDGADLRITQRQYRGDINTNDRLDTGDAFLMQRMLTGADEVRAWDHVLNDLNDSAVLDSGDVVRLLRVVVGIDEQPGSPAPAGKSGGAKSDRAGPKFRLDLDRDHGSSGDLVTLRVYLDEPGFAPAGASFSLDYPAEALRLADESSHQAGSLVGGDSLVLWNLAPDQDDYENQSGEIAFVASSSQAWAGGAAGGEVARFTFEVQAGAAAQARWEIRLEGGEVPSHDGFDLIAVPDASVSFIGQATIYASWIESFLEPEQIGDPTYAAPDADPDGDGIGNLAEYGSGTDPVFPDAVHAPRPMLNDLADQGTAEIEFDRSLTAVDLAYSVQRSSDLLTWSDLGQTDSVIVRRVISGDGRSERLTVRDLSGSGGADAQIFLRVRFGFVAGPEP